MNDAELLTREQVDQLIALINHEFSTMTKLVECVSKIGVPSLEKFKNKGKQRELTEKQLSRYVRVVKKRDIIPDWPKPGTCFIAEVYDPPLPREDKRGKDGKYINLLKPLILSTKEFSGKIYELANEWGLFSEYIKELYPNSYFEGNIWKPKSWMSPGERRYRAIMDYQGRDRIKYALKSLADEQKICYRERLMYMSELTVSIEDEDNDLEFPHQRLKTLNELREDMCRVAQLIEAIKFEDNYTLSPDDFTSLNLASSRNNSTDRAENRGGKLDHYKMEYYQNRQTLSAIEATPDEVKTYQQYKAYVRFLACLSYLTTDGGNLPKINQLLNNEYKFFQNHKLADIYYKLDQELRPELLGWRFVWKDITFTVLDEFYTPLTEDAANLLKKKLTYRFVEYMGVQINNPLQVFYGDPDFTDDYQTNQTFLLKEDNGQGKAQMEWWEREHTYPLKQSKAAHAIQQKLEELYPPIEE